MPSVLLFIKYTLGKEVIILNESSGYWPGQVSVFGMRGRMKTKRTESATQIEQVLITLSRQTTGVATLDANCRISSRMRRVRYFGGVISSELFSVGVVTQRVLF